MRRCSISDCDKRHKARGWCDKHYARWRAHGSPLVGAFVPSQGFHRDGYLCRMIDGKRVAVHRLVMQSVIGRSLLPEETVHHINGVRDDNRPENLELWNQSHPCGQRVVDKLAWAHRIVELYEPIESTLSVD